jgi:non-canonical purine NTP pyrophosphatase (RdgB/HAM1 family)
MQPASMGKVVLASSNQGKLAEFGELFAGSGLEVVPQASLGVDDADETGLTFIENALLKARHAAQRTGLPALADDSGLCVDHLHGAPTMTSCCAPCRACRPNSAVRSSSACWCCCSTPRTPRR